MSIDSLPLTPPDDQLIARRAYMDSLLDEVMVERALASGTDKEHEKEQIVVSSLLDDNDLRIKEQIESDRRIAELDKIAHTDKITGLPNELGLERAYKKMVTGSQDHTYGEVKTDRREPGHSQSILFIDLDGFAELNKRAGHNTGDLALGGVGQIASEVLSWFRKKNSSGPSLRNNDVVGRLHGDEFVILLDGADTAGAQAVAEKLIVLIGNITHVDGKKVDFGASIGIAEIDPNENFKTALEKPDQAMSEAKKRGKNRAVLFDKESGEFIDALITGPTVGGLDRIVGAIATGQTEV